MSNTETKMEDSEQKSFFNTETEGIIHYFVKNSRTREIMRKTKKNAILF